MWHRQGPSKYFYITSNTRVFHLFTDAVSMAEFEMTLQ